MSGSPTTTLTFLHTRTITQSEPFAPPAWLGPGDVLYSKFYATIEVGPRLSEQLVLVNSECYSS